MNAACSQRWAGLLVRIAVAALLALAGGPAAAQRRAPTPDWLARPARVKAVDASFRDLLALVPLPRGYVMDGTPLLEKASLTVGGTVRDALDRACDVFDYTWSVSKSGAVLLRKRFRSLQDEPQMHAAEMRKVADDVLKVMHAVAFAEDGNFEQYLRALAASLSSEQVAALRSGAPIPGTRLAPAQQALLVAAINTNTFDKDCPAWLLLYDQLDRIEKAYLTQEDNKFADMARQPVALVLYTLRYDGEWLQHSLRPGRSWLDYRRNMR